MPRRPAPPLFRFDPGYLFIIAGLTLAASVVLIPAVDDRDQARHVRDKALALETYRASTLARHAQYLDALSARDPVLVRALAVARRHAAPADRELLLPPPDLQSASFTVMTRLEGDYTPPPPPRANESLLRRMATNPTLRLWLLASSAMAILFGLLPQATRQRAAESARTTVRRGAALPAE